MAERILVTGANGWLGSRLVRWLIDRRDRDTLVFAMVRPGADRWRFRDVEGAITVVEADLKNSSVLDRVLESIRPQTCFHFAWYAVPQLYWQSRENLDSLWGSIALALKLADLGCTRFVGIGTCAEYDIGNQPLTEAAPTNPKSLYPASKLAFALVLEQIARSRGMRWLWPRLFYQFGPYEDARRLVPAIARSLLAGEPALLTSGEQQRDYLHADDVVSAIGTAAASELDGPVNIGSGTAVRIADLARTIGNLMGHPELIRLGARTTGADEPPYICADSTRLRATGWRPTYNLEAGLAATINWFRCQAVSAEQA